MTNKSLKFKTMILFFCGKDYDSIKSIYKYLKFKIMKGTSTDVKTPLCSSDNINERISYIYV